MGPFIFYGLRLRAVAGVDGRKTAIKPSFLSENTELSQMYIVCRCGLQNELQKLTVSKRQSTLTPRLMYLLAQQHFRTVSEHRKN
jgi:hypothetical protein